MKTRKNIFFVGMVLLLVFSLFGCSPANTPANEEETITDTVEVEASPTSEPTEIETPVETFPFEGIWEGRIDVAGMGIDSTIEFLTIEDGFSALLTLPGQVEDYEMKNVSFEDNLLHLEAFGGSEGGLAIWEGGLTEEGSLEGTYTQNNYEGTFVMYPEGQTPVEPVVEATLDPALIGMSIEGIWEGELVAAGSYIGIVVEFKTINDEFIALIDIPGQSAYDLPTSNFSYDGENVYFEAFESGGRTAVFDGAIRSETRMDGLFSQAGYDGTFWLERSEATAEELPYLAEEVTFTNGDITLSGTLTIPEGEGPFPAAVLISGSGAQNRDEEIYGFKLFGIIADYLTRQGIAVLRYDDRGIGGSNGVLSDASQQDLSEDVLAAVELLKSYEAIDSTRIGLIGHSEGGIIAPLAANQSEDVNWVVLVAGTAATGREVIYDQMAVIMRISGSSEEEIEEAVIEAKATHDALLEGGDAWEARKEVIFENVVTQIENLSDEDKEEIGDLDEYAQMVFESTTAQVENTWFIAFLQFDPVEQLEQLQIPVLAYFGGLDTQVTVELNQAAMETALETAGNQDYTIVVFPTANHLFQDAETGSPDEYSLLEKTFVPDFLETMSDWILTH